VTLLGSLLPGLRELRAPLAAGYLWVFLCWLLFADRLPDDAASASSPLREVYELAALTGPVGLAVAASFAAYLIGILSVAVFRFAGRAASYASSYVFREILRGGTSLFNRLPRRAGSMRGFASVGNRLWRVQERLGQRVQSTQVWNSIAWGMAVTVLARRFSTNTGFRRRVVESFEYNLKTAVLEGPEVRWIGGISKALQEEFQTLQSDQSESGLEAARRAVEIDLWPKLTDIAEFDRRLAKHIVSTAYQFSPRSLGWTLDLENDLRLAPAQLAVSAPPAYDRWDRLEGEAEFRFAVVPPMAMLVALGWERGWLHPLLSILLLIPLAVLLLLGTQNAQRAREQLVAAIEARVIDSDAFKKLIAEDLFPNMDGVEATSLSR
jgi:hypothetical protein